MFENEKLTAWLEECVKNIYEFEQENKIVSGAVVMVSEDGISMTGYLNADAQDKAIMAYHLNADAMLDVVLANADLVKNAIEGVEDDDSGEED